MAQQVKETVSVMTGCLRAKRGKCMLMTTRLRHGLRALTRCGAAPCGTGLPHHAQPQRSASEWGGREGHELLSKPIPSALRDTGVNLKVTGSRMVALSSAVSSHESARRAARCIKTCEDDFLACPIGHMLTRV